MQRPMPQKGKAFLVFEVRFLFDRYHGLEWPPSSRRFFLALISALYQGKGRRVGIEEGREALRLLERNPPVIHAQPLSKGSDYTIFVPNNNLAPGSQRGSTNKPSFNIKSPKTSKPLSTYVVTEPLSYCWELEPDDYTAADILCRLSKEVAVFGLGIDAVVVCGQITDYDRTLKMSTRYIPDEHNGDLTIQTPVKGLLENAEEREKGMRNRMKGNFFTKPMAITKFKEQRYRKDNLTSSLVGFMLRHIPSDQNTSMQKNIISDEAAKEAIERITALKNAVVGAEMTQSIKTILLPSIGGKHADAKIRRVAFLTSHDLTESLERLDGQTFKMGIDTYQLELLPPDDRVVRAYRRKTRFFASVTPIKLSPPGSTSEDILHSVIRAIRSEKIDAKLTFLSYRREPYWGTRPSSAPVENRYVELEFETSVAGPLIIGKEQERGCGLLAPKTVSDVAYFQVLGERVPVSMTVAVGDAMKRTAMSQIERLQNHPPTAPEDNRYFWLPVDSDQDGFIDHIAVYVTGGFDHLTMSALGRISKICDGQSLKIDMRLVEFSSRIEIVDKCPMFGKHKAWRAATPYFMPWHIKKGSTRDAQLAKECKKMYGKRYEKMNLQVSVRDSAIRISNRTIPTNLFWSKHGNQSPIRNTGEAVVLEFNREIQGPLALGFGRHFGLGLFIPDNDP